MGPIVLAGFTGCNTALGPRMLAESVGVLALDCNPSLPAELRPLRSPATVAAATAGGKTLYRMGRTTLNEAAYWISWPGLVSVALSSDGNDASERTYITGNGPPAWFDNVTGLGSPPYPTTTRALAMPAPTIAPLLTIVSQPDTGDQGDVTYVHTWVNDIGWESAPSPVRVVNIKPGSTVRIEITDEPPQGSYFVNRVRIYRTAVGSTATTVLFQLLLEAPWASGPFTDSGQALGYEIATIGWLPLPDDAHHLTALWASMFAALSGKSVLISEVGIPYAYPEKYTIPTFDTPVALGKFGQTLVVLTTGKPIAIQGQTPAGLADEPLPVNHPCVAAASVVSFAHGVCWASSEGIGYVGAAGQSPYPLTFEIIDPDQWKALNPASMTGTNWGRFYVVSYDAGSGRKALMIDPLNPKGGVTFLSTGYEAAYYDELLKALYVLDGGAVKRFDGAAPYLPATFRSKRFHQTAGRSFPRAEVTASSYPVTFRLFCDGVLKLEKSVLDGSPFGLPAGFQAEDWQVEIAATGPVQSVRLGTTEQLRSGVA